MTKQEKLQKTSELFYSTIPLVKKIFMGNPPQNLDEIQPFLYSTVLCVYFNGRNKMSRISEITGMSKPLITQQVERLVEAGLLERFYDANDRRIVGVDITEKGRAFAKKLTTLYAQRGCEILSSLSEEDFTAFTESYQTIKRILQKLDKPNETKQ